MTKLKCKPTLTQDDIIFSPPRLITPNEIITLCSKLSTLRDVDITDEYAELLDDLIRDPEYFTVAQLLKLKECIWIKKNVPRFADYNGESAKELIESEILKALRNMR